MKIETYNADWLETLRRQEELLRMAPLTPDDTLKLGCIMARYAKERFGRGVAIRIITQGQITFSHLMEGADTYNNWWMDKKLNTSRVTGMSSIRSLVEIALGLYDAAEEFNIDNNYALCGGCFPLRTPEGRLFGYVECSGLPHQYDHAVIVGALSEFTGIEIPALSELK